MKPKIRSMASLEKEMRAVAQGKRKAPRDAAQPSFESVEALLRLLTKENRTLLATIKTKKPESIAELSTLSGRDAPNLTRTLAKMVAAGLVQLVEVDRRKRPVVIAKEVRVAIDPSSQNDRIEFETA